jgi:uncharacterized protein YigA (DUF484 family)
MVSKVSDLQAKIAVLERYASANVEALHGIRMRTSRVLAATNAFAKVEIGVRSLGQLVRTLVSLARVSEESVDREYIEGELARLRSELSVLEATYAGELQLAARMSASPPPRHPWWQVWRRPTPRT